jgi:hypothetical protein
VSWGRSASAHGGSKPGQTRPSGTSASVSGHEAHFLGRLRPQPSRHPTSVVRGCASTEMTRKGLEGPLGRTLAEQRREKDGELSTRLNRPYDAARQGLQATYKAVFMDVFIAWISNDRACQGRETRVRFRQTTELGSLTGRSRRDVRERTSRPRWIEADQPCLQQGKIESDDRLVRRHGGHCADR